MAHGKLTKATVSDIPLYCASGGPAIPVTFTAASIASKTGAFTTTGTSVVKVGPFKGKVGEKLELFGRFTSHGIASGFLQTSFVLNGPQCTGKSAFRATV